MDTGFSRVEVLDARRERVDQGNSRVTPDDHYLMVVSLRPGLPDGLYTVAWRNLSEADGHTLSGAYPLIVGALSEGVARASRGNDRSAPVRARSGCITSLAVRGRRHAGRLAPGVAIRLPAGAS
jgi:copper transport protein